MSVTAPIAHGKLAGLDEIAALGTDAARGGFSRHLWDSSETELRGWFISRATALGLDVHTDGNANMWAWWGTPGPNAVITGSHLDSVPGGGEYDGPLGVVSALDAIAALQASGFVPQRPVAVVVFAEEEGSRFGVACLGSRLMTGAISVDKAFALTDAGGTTFAEAAVAAGYPLAGFGRDSAALANIGLFIELHVEQGRGLIDLGSPLAIASSILAHGRWRVSFSGQGNHAGATGMRDRRDPTIAAAKGILAINEAALDTADARATVGRLLLVPGGTNVIASSATAWLDVRAGTDHETRALVADIEARLAEVSESTGCEVSVSEESWSSVVDFDRELGLSLGTALGGVPLLPTGAGHDAGVLSGEVPTAMVFVRNPTGVSHSPEEFAELADCLEGVVALEKLLRSVLS